MIIILVFLHDGNTYRLSKVLTSVVKPELLTVLIAHMSSASMNVTASVIPRCRREPVGYGAAL